MRRTKANPGPSKGGRVPRLVHVEYLEDHAGDPIIRARWGEPTRPMPADFKAQPTFVFQVYSTIELSLCETAAARRGDCAVSPTAHKDLSDLLAYLNSSLDSAQKAAPIFEFYERPLPDALAMVDHQRKEIQYRKAQTERRDVLQIPKLRHSMWDRRRHGFLIAINSGGFRLGSLQSHFDPNGPLWVHFDRRLPAASSVEIKRRVECDEMQALKAEDVIEIYTEKMEIEVQRKQQYPMGLDLGLMYSRSYRMMFAEDDPCQEIPPMDYAQNEDEIGMVLAEVTTAPSELPELVGLTLQRHADHVVVESQDLEGDATVKYLVFAQYLAPSSMDLLEAAAINFTSALAKELPIGTTMNLEFRIPQQKTLSSVFQTYKMSEAAQAGLQVGALTSSTLVSTRTVEEQYTKSAPSLPARIYPISRSADIVFNDPRTSQYDLYRTFLVVLDKPDFVEQSGVLFLMTDGGKQRTWPSWRPQNAPDLDYSEMQVWRSAGMKEVADRLAMVFRS